MSDNDTKETLLEEAKKYLECRRKVVTINGKKPTLDEWTPLRDMNISISIEQVRDWLSNPLAERIAILLDKSLLAFDYDGAGEYVIWNKLIPRCSPGLQNAFHQTTLTKTPHGGHALFGIDVKDFPEGIKEVQCWWNGKDHNQVVLLSQNKYLVERGTGYQAVRGIDSLVKLSKVQVSELISLLQLIRLKTIAKKQAVDALLPYYYKTNRDNLTFGLSGFLYKGGLEEYLIKYVQEYLMDGSGMDAPQERQERFNVIKYTCAKDRNTAGVSGREKLLEAVNNDENVLITIQRAFKPLGYFKGSNSNTTTDSTNNGDQVEERKAKIATILYQIVSQNIEALFRNQFKEAYATIKIDEHVETIQVSDKGRFKMWIYKVYFDTEGKLLTNSDAVTYVCNKLESDAYFGKDVRALDLRVSAGLCSSSTITSTTNGPIQKIYYDLTNDDWDVIKITQDDWSALKSAEVPVMFKRHNEIPQVMPYKEYPPDIIDQFMDLINLNKDCTMRLLFKCYIISLFIPRVSKAILMLHGPEGAAKTGCQELIKSLVDPSSVKTLTFPDSKAELIQQLSHNYIAYYDNVEVVKGWLSNELCRAVTGSGFSKRKLYSDDDDVIYQFKRCLGINGTGLAATKADLLDRGFIAELEAISEEDRRKWEEDILPQFEEMKPFLLGYIFSILLKVLRKKSDKGVELKTRSRLADWEEWAEIISQCMGYESMEFVNAFRANRKLKAEVALEARPISQAVIKFMECESKSVGVIKNLDGELVWNGRATELLGLLESAAEQLNIKTQQNKLWPKSASSLSYRLKEVKVSLETVGIILRDYKDSSRARTRYIEIRQIPSDNGKTPSGASGASEDSNSRSNETNISDGDSQSRTTMPSKDKTPSDEEAENDAQNRPSDGADASDDLFTNPGEDTKSWSVGTSEQAEAFKDEVARIGKSKVADMAVANSSGDDVMFGDKKKSE